MPKNEFDLYINENIPYLILKSIKNKKIKFIHLSSINDLYEDLKDIYTISKRVAEKKILGKNLTLIRPNLIYSKTNGFSNQVIEGYLNIKLPIYSMIYPGNIYKPVWNK